MQRKKTNRSRRSYRRSVAGLWALAAVGVLVLAALATWTMQPTIEAELHTRVAGALQGTGLNAENVVVDGASVSLQGVVDSKDTLTDVAELVRTVDGVSSVDNQLLTADQQLSNQTRQNPVDASKPPTIALVPTTDSGQSDTALTDQPERKPASLSLMINSDTIDVTGNIGDAKSADLIYQTVSTHFPAHTMNNNLQVGDEFASAKWLNGLVSLLPALADLKNTNVKIADGRGLVSGAATDAQTIEQALTAIDKALSKTLTITSELKLNTSSVATSKPAPTISKVTASKNKQLIEKRSTLRGSDKTADDVEQARQLKLAIQAADPRRIKFSNGLAQPSDESFSALDAIATAIQQYPAPKVEIAGHTDASGSAFANLDLSKKRADAIREYLIGKGVPANRLRAVGYGETRPVANNSTPDGRRANRRIEFTL